jgi:hypothetical protein
MDDVAGIEKVFSILDAACDEQDDKERANRLFLEAESLAKRLLENNPSDAELYYGIALSWYHRWAPPEERRGRVHAALMKAQSMAPYHPWIPLFLGYQQFDDGDYRTALESFSRVDRQYFESRDLQWRNLKTQELVLCCQIRLATANQVSLQALRQLVSAYLAADDVDRPMPKEIVELLAASEHRRRLNASEGSVAAELRRLIIGLGDEKVFERELSLLGTGASRHEDFY